MNCWDILGIEPIDDVKIIKRAYARKLKIYHPEDDPNGFQALRDAYERALKQAEFQKNVNVLPDDECEMNIQIHDEPLMTQKENWRQRDDDPQEFQKLRDAYERALRDEYRKEANALVGSDESLTIQDDDPQEFQKLRDAYERALRDKYRKEANALVGSDESFITQDDDSQEFQKLRETYERALKDKYRKEAVDSSVHDENEGEILVIDNDPQEFQKLRDAYERALRDKYRKEVLVDSGERLIISNDNLQNHHTQETMISTNDLVEQFMHTVENLYKQDSWVGEVYEWEMLLEDEKFWRIDIQPKLSDRLLAFLMDHRVVSQEVWTLLTKHFSWHEQQEELCRKFPEEFIDLIMMKSGYQQVKTVLTEPSEIQETKSSISWGNISIGFGIAILLVVIFFSVYDERFAKNVIMRFWLFIIIILWRLRHYYHD